jgi:hypothetical protein
VKPPVNATVAGDDGMTNPAGNVTEMVLGAASAPTAVGVKPTVHVETAPADCGAPVNVTPVTTPLEITTFAAGEFALVSLLVTTEKLVFVYGPAAGFVIPDTVTNFALPDAAAHEPVNVTVTTWPTTTPVVGHVPVNPVVNATDAGDDGITNPPANVNAIVSPDDNPPTLLGVNPTAHDADAPADCGEPTKLTPLTELAAITTAEAGEAAVASRSVRTENVPGP